MSRFFAFAAGVSMAAAVPAIVGAQPMAAPHPGNATETGVAATAAGDASPIDPASLAVARQILTIAFPPERRVRMYDSMMRSITDQSLASMANAADAGDKDFRNFVDGITRRMFERLTPIMTAALPDYFESMAHAYARDFSRDELEAVLAFVKTPAGQHYFERSASLLQDPDVQAASRRMLAKIMAEAPEINREEQREIADYVAARMKQGRPIVPAPTS